MINNVRERNPMPEQPREVRCSNFDEVALGYTEADAIREAIAELEYRVNPFARSLKTQRSRFVAVLLPDMTAPFYGAVLAALNKVLRPEGYHTLVSCYSSNHGLERDNLQFLLSIGADGLIYTPEDLTAEEFTELTANSGVPIVLLDRSISGVQADTVLVNNTDSVYQAVSRLMEQGHERIGIISGPKSVFTAKERLIGYLSAAKTPLRLAIRA